MENSKHIINELVEFLDKYAAEQIIMYKTKDRRDLIKTLNVRGGNGILLHGIDALNCYLEELKLPYMIFEYTASRVLDGKEKKFKSAWRVVKVHD